MLPADSLTRRCMRKRRASPVTRLDRCMRWQGLQSLKAESSLGLRGNIRQLASSNSYVSNSYVTQSLSQVLGYVAI